MKTSILVAAIIACVMSVPTVSAQDKPMSAKSATSMDMMQMMMEQMLQHDQAMAPLPAK